MWKGRVPLLNHCARMIWRHQNNNPKSQRTCCLVYPTLVFGPEHGWSPGNGTLSGSVFPTRVSSCSAVYPKPETAAFSFRYWRCTYDKENFSQFFIYRFVRWVKIDTYLAMRDSCRAHIHYLNLHWHSRYIDDPSKRQPPGTQRLVHVYPLFDEHIEAGGVFVPEYVPITINIPQIKKVKSWLVRGKKVDRHIHHRSGQ